MANVLTHMVATTPNTKSKPLPQLARNGSSSDDPSSLRVQRRTIAWGIAGAVLGLKLGDENAWAAKRVPAAPVEKNDPSVTGVLAKVMASKRRKEAMKEAMAKQRERGRPIE